jgi:glycosyltransferase involved in cell wall biosynthesis
MQYTIHGGQIDQIKKTTVLMALYDSRKFLLSKISSLNQLKNFDDAMFVFINCQNLGNESALLESFAGKHKNVCQIIINDYCTLYEAWDLGIKLTNSKYITNYNADDQWHPDYLLKCQDYLDNHGDAIVSTQVLIANRPNQVYPCWDYINRMPALPYPHSTAGPSPMWRRSLHDSYGYFGKYRVIGDARFWERMHANGEKFGLIHEDLVLYYSSPDSLERRVDLDTGRFLRDLDITDERLP